MAPEDGGGPGAGGRSAPVRDPAAEVLALPDGRLLVRHRRGLSLLSGISPAELRATVEAFDGERSAAEAGEHLAVERGPETARRLVGAVWGDLVRVPAGAVREDQASPGGGRLAVLASGPGGEELARRLGERFPGLPLELVAIASFAASETPAFRRRDRELRVLPAAPRAPRRGSLEGVDRGSLAPRLAGRELVVAALEEAPYRALLEVQAAGLEAAVPVLFVRADPDGVHVGPLVAPGGSLPCLGCALAAALAPVGLGGDLLELAGHLRTGRLDARWAGAAVAGEVAALLDPAGIPRGVAGALLVDPAGGLRTLPFPRREGCAACPPPAPTAAVAPRVADLAARLEAARVRAAEGRPSSVAAAPAGDRGPAALSVAILGGGAAGYLAALALRARRPAARVTLIEAPELPPIGVGEATTPLMPQFLHADLGIGARELFAAVRPTFKLGIRFVWGEPGGGGFPYPFGPVRTLEAKVWDGDLEAASLHALHMAAGTLPVRAAAAADEGEAELRCGFGTEVAYHLDSGRFATFLGSLARRRGVEVVAARIAGAELTPDGGSVAALAAEDGRRFTADLYLDCSGFRALLAGDALGSPWIDYSGSLFTDRAVVGAVPHAGRLAPCTHAETFEAGWCWSIPQEDADHVGYVHASAFATGDRAAEELARRRPGVAGLRELGFRAGRRRDFWLGNVVALGNAYGFVEPLESTALHLLIRQIGLLLRALPGEGPPPPALGATRALLNRRVGAFWDYVRWFLALHFRFNRRSGSPFWRACREDADVSAHGEILELFRERGPLAYQGAVATAFDFPDPLWGAAGVDVVLLGQGVPAPLPRPAWCREAWREHVRLARAVAAASLPQERVLAAAGRHPEVLDALEAGFRARGPAF